MDGDALRSAVRLFEPAPDQGPFLRARAQAHRLVVGRSARGAGKACRAIAGLEPARSISRRLSGRAVDGSDRARLDLRRGAGTGARGPPRSPSAGLVYAALSAQEA